MTIGLVEDRYLLGEVVGRGDISVVHRARDLKLSRDVAVKVLRTDLAGDPLLQNRFRRAARSAGHLNDPAIVAIYDAGEMPSGTGQVPFVVLEYVDGQSLRDLIARNGPLSPARAMAKAADLCAALECCHHHGIVHGNMTSSTVMIDSSAAVKVMDFGAMSMGEEEAPATTSARSGTGADPVTSASNGQSPEQIHGLPVDARTGELPQELQHGRHRGWAMAGLSALGAAIAIAVWLTWTVISAAPVRALVSVPDLSGMTVSQASALLQDSQLVLGPVLSVQSATTDAGRVLSQRPSERTEVAHDSLVTLRIGAQ